MNKYPLWKYLLIALVLVLGFFYAVPNLFAPDPAVQISGQSSSMVLDESTAELAEAALAEAGIAVKAAELAENGRNLLVRLEQRDQQLRAQRLLQRALGDGYVTALNLAPTTPDWMVAVGGAPMKLGLDLSGGVHFLLEVDTQAALAQRVEFYSAGIRRQLREARIRGLVEEHGTTMVGRFRDSEAAEAAIDVVREQYRELGADIAGSDGEVRVTWRVPEATVREIEQYAVEQNLTTLRNRVNELGVAEPLVQRQGRNRIVVQLPGIQDTAEAKRIIGKTANLEFRLEARGDAAPETREQFEFRNTEQGRARAWLERELVITGERVANASAGFDTQSGQPEVNITLDSDGGTLMHRATRNNIGRQLGVLFIERKNRTTYERDADGNEVAVQVPYDEKRIISLATIRDALGVRFRITGLNSPAEAAELALLLRAGALAAPMNFVEERTVGPSLGAENIDQGITAVIAGFIATAVLIVAIYKLFGVVAVIALSLNVVLLVALMSLLSATLTMPGIAGIVLTIGMAVDANVLIYSRIREELRNGLGPQQAIHAGFDRAYVTILDSNLTTLLVAVILYAVGTGPVRGFAVTLSLGIATSMFTAILATRAIINLAVGGRRLQKLWI